MPSKRIIVLDASRGNSATSPRYRVAFWADVPAARQATWAAIAPSASAWKDASAAENTDLTTGAVAERVISYQSPTGKTLAQIKAALEADWAQWDTYVQNYNPWDRYGTFWAGDGSSWTDAGAS